MTRYFHVVYSLRRSEGKRAPREIGDTAHWSSLRERNEACRRDPDGFLADRRVSPVTQILVSFERGGATSSDLFSESA